MSSSRSLAEVVVEVMARLHVENEADGAPKPGGRWWARQMRPWASFRCGGEVHPGCCGGSVGLPGRVNGPSVAPRDLRGRGSRPGLRHRQRHPGGRLVPQGPEGGTRAALVETPAPTTSGAPSRAGAMRAAPLVVLVAIQSVTPCRGSAVARRPGNRRRGTGSPRQRDQRTLQEALPGASPGRRAQSDRPERRGHSGRVQGWGVDQTADRCR